MSQSCANLILPIEMPSHRLVVLARRTRHLRFNEVGNPAQAAREKDFAAVIEWTLPVVGQHKRLDSSNPDVALLPTRYAESR